MTGSTLDNTNAKAVRAHTTRANFTRRRRRLVREHVERKEYAALIKTRQIGADEQTTGRNQAVDVQLPIFSHPSLNQKLNGKDAFLIDHCA